MECSYNRVLCIDMCECGHCDCAHRTQISRCGRTSENMECEDCECPKFQYVKPDGPTFTILVIE